MSVQDEIPPFFVSPGNLGIAPPADPAGSTMAPPPPLGAVVCMVPSGNVMPLPLPDTLRLPATSSFAPGVGVPIPTLPLPRRNMLLFTCRLPQELKLSLNDPIAGYVLGNNPTFSPGPTRTCNGWIGAVVPMPTLPLALP